MKIGTKIRKIRELKELSQENVALELNMSLTGYGKIERNEVGINFDKLVQISEVFNISVVDIIEFDESNALKIVSTSNQYQIDFDSIIKNYEYTIMLLKEKINILENNK